jgi:nucleoside-diphosphate-sugar epimerase
VAVLTLVEFAADQWQSLTRGPGPSWEVQTEPGMVEAEDLTLDPTLAHETLGWRGVWDWRQAISKTLEWYVASAGGTHPRELIHAQFEEYSA